MKRILIGASVILLLCVGAAPAALAQATSTPSPTATYNNTQRVQYATIPFASNCNPFSPCGALPWPVPRFATLDMPSPTIIEVHSEPATPTGTYVPTATSSPTPLIDIGPVSTFAGEIGTLGSQISVQSTKIVVVNGTAVGVNEISAGLGSLIGAPFGFVKAIQTSIGGMGLIGTMLNFAFFAFFFVLFVNLAVLAFPLLRWLFSLALQVLDAIKP
jgi:hypothetical protein